MDEDLNHTVYDFTNDQLDIRRIYELRTAALVGRDYHGNRLVFLRRINYSLEAISTIAASSAFVGLAFWKSTVGSGVLSLLVLAVAVSGVIRASFRLSELIDQHARLSASWKEMFLDFDVFLENARRVGHVDERIRVEMNFLCERFRRVESMDDIRASDAEITSLQQQAENKLQPEKGWLPST